MAVIVQKYGGTSVGDAERIRRVAERVVAAADEKRRLCVVVSAMGGTTDELLELAAQVSTRPHERELDMLLTAGERISMALLSMAIIELGRTAVSFTGSQAGIVTDTRHGRAHIVDVRAGRVLEALDTGKIVIVAGFQGVSTAFDVTTLGRGGSDTTAVALAAALGAEMCEINTDVAGVFSADPRIVPGARKLDALSYEEMLELSACGAKVLMLRSVEYARNHRVPLHVRSTFSDERGTWIREGDPSLEQAIISGIAHDTSEAKVTILGVPDRPGVAARIFRPLADEGVNVDMIVQNARGDSRTDITFTIPKDELRRAEQVLRATAADVDAAGVSTDSNIAKVSLVGAGMKTHPGVAADMFDALGEAGINVDIISTSSIRISCIVAAARMEEAVRVIHARFGLADDAVTSEQAWASAAHGARAAGGAG